MASQQPVSNGDDATAPRGLVTDVATARRGVWRSLISPSVSLNMTIALLLFACFWMPQVTGCDGKEVRPSAVSWEALAEGAWWVPITTFWTHWAGLGLALLLLCASIMWRDNFVRVMLGGTTLLWILPLAFFGLLVWEEGFDIKVLLTLAPPMLLMGWILVRASMRRDWMTLWAWLSSFLMVLGLLSTVLIYLFNQEGRYGLVVNYFCLVSLLFTPWVLWSRWERDILDSAAPVRRLRFRISHIMIAATILAVGITYYRLLSDWE